MREACIIRGMTDESLTVEEFLERCRQAVATAEDENGIDVTQIDALLAMSPTDRLRTLEEFMEEADALAAAGKKAHGKAARAAVATSRGGG
jgi:hypothetical protein